MASWTRLIVRFMVLVTISRANEGDDAMLVRFRNIANYDIVLWWLTPHQDEEIRFFGHLSKNGGMTSFTSYSGHRFFWAKPGKEQDASQRRGFFNIRKDTTLYLYSDDDSPGDSELIQNSWDEVEFLYEYYKTYHRHWLSTYQRPPPVIPFVEMDASNPRTKWVESSAFFWKCDGNHGTETKAKGGANTPSRILSKSSLDRECMDIQPEPLRFMLENLYPQDPRIYRIPNFINQIEAEHIIKEAMPFMHRSTVGNGRDKRQDPTRTCSNTWVSMNQTKVIENVYRRIGDVLGIPSYKMDVGYTMPNKQGEVEGVASHMEVVHFGTGEHYNRHYDNSVTDEIFLHFITFQVVLKTAHPLKGGQTNFPHAHAATGDTGFNVDSVEYDAVFWFNLLPDGNLDDTSMYSHAKVEEGEQWLFHISIWDPTLPVEGDPQMPHDRMYSFHDEL